MLWWWLIGAWLTTGPTVLIWWWLSKVGSARRQVIINACIVDKAKAALAERQSPVEQRQDRQFDRTSRDKEVQSFDTVHAASQTGRQTVSTLAK